MAAAPEATRELDATRGPADPADSADPTPAHTPAPADGRYAHVIKDDREAIEAAQALSDDFAVEAAQRDQDRRLPWRELEHLSASGLLAVTVPRTHGGPDVTPETLAEVFRLLAKADPSIAQIPHSHFVYINVLLEEGSPAQKEFFLAEVLAGKRIANAQTERNTRHIKDLRTRLTKADDGGYILSGTKFYTTGALFADWLGVMAKGDDDLIYVAYVRRDSPGVAVDDDWDGLGQRTTASGTVHLDDVKVLAEHVVPHHLTFDRPQLYGALAQLLHTAIEVGIAGAALDEAAEFVRTKSRPWFESGLETAAEEPLLIQRFGELAIRVRAAEALLAQAARAVGAARQNLTEDTAAEASVAVAVAKAFAGEVAVEVSSAVFEVSGTRSALTSLNLSRHWRNARTHSLHDPARWKVQHIGRYVLNGTRPPRHGLL
jgi:SfnB family sulfur acquisition oxidoreductase